MVETSVANSSSTNAVAEIIQAMQALAESVGPGWGLAILLVILLFLPKYGVAVHLAELWKEDRADDRKRKNESDRLMAKYRNRASLQPPPRRLSQKKEKP